MFCYVVFGLCVRADEADRFHRDAVEGVGAGHGGNEDLHDSGHRERRKEGKKERLVGRFGLVCWLQRSKKV